jgi:hypothetical protein
MHLQPYHREVREAREERHFTAEYAECAEIARLRRSQAAALPAKQAFRNLFEQNRSCAEGTHTQSVIRSKRTT